MRGFRAIRVDIPHIAPVARRRFLRTEIGVMKIGMGVLCMARSRMHITKTRNGVIGQIVQSNRSNFHYTEKVGAQRASPSNALVAPLEAVMEPLRATSENAILSPVLPKN